MKRAIILVIIGAMLLISGTILFLKPQNLFKNKDTRWKAELVNTLAICDKGKCNSKYEIEYRKYSNNYNNKELQKEIDKINELNDKAYNNDKNSKRCVSKNYNISEQTIVETFVFDNKDYISVLYYTVTENICFDINGSKKSKPNIFVLSKKTDRKMSDKDLLKEFNISNKEMNDLYKVALEKENLEGTIKDYKHQLYISPYGKLVLLYYKDTSSTYYSMVIKEIDKN